MNRTVALASLAALAAAGCQSCHEDHPYVPYAIGDVEPRPTPSAEARPAAPEAGAPSAFVVQASEVAPADAKTWSLGGLKLVAPEGDVFQLGLARDFDGDGVIDVMAVSRSKAAPSHAHVLYFAGAAAAASKPPLVVADPPAFAGDPTCSGVQRLAGVGPRSVYVEIGVECAGHGEATPVKEPVAPSRWAAVVGAPAGQGATPALRIAWLLQDPAGAPTLTLDVDASDVDGDGRDDVTLRVTLDGGAAPFEAGPRVSTLLRWIDRPAGMSREPDQPEASLLALAQGASGRATKAKDAALVPPLAHRIRALYDAVCAEGGLPRLTRAEGHPIECGPSSRALEEAGLAEARSLLTAADVLGAIAALDRAEEVPAARTPARVTDLQTAIAQSAPVAQATSLRVINAIPLLDHGASPSWGAVAFEPSGKLLVRTLGPVVRVDPAQGDEAEAPDVQAWKSAVSSPDGSLRWSSVRDLCDGSDLRASFASQAGDAEGKVVLLPLPGRAGGRCARAGAVGPPAVPVSWGQEGLFAFIAGEPVSFAVDLSHASVAPGTSAGTAPPLGAPRSPDGKTVVAPTSMGILVKGARTRLYRAKELDGAYGELRDCAVSDDAIHVACTRGGRAFVGTW